MLFNTVVLLAIVAVLCTKVVNAADVSGYWSENDLTKVQQQAKSIAKNSRNNNEIYHALQLLKKFGSLEDSCNCDSVIFASNSAETPLDWFFSKSNSDACGCSVSVPNQVLDGLQDSLSVCYSLINCFWSYHSPFRELLCFSFVYRVVLWPK